MNKNLTALIVLGFAGTGIVTYGAIEGAAKAETPISKIEVLQEEYFAKHGKYLQVKEGNQLPDYEQGTVEQKFGKRIDDTYVVNTYESPRGKGYFIVYSDAKGTHSVGYGPDAAQFTRQLIVATST